MQEGDDFPGRAETMGKFSSTCPRASEDGGRETAFGLSVSESQENALFVASQKRVNQSGL